MIAGEFVEFANQHGELLRGFLHEPAPHLARGICVLLLSPGIKGRVGPHRLYLKLARALVPMGFHVLRFDCSGLGDATGEITDSLLADVYTSIQMGRNVEDTISAMDWLQANYGVRKFVGSGLCGGSITALLAARKDQRIDCLLGIGLPTILEGGPESRARILTQQQVLSLRSKYIQKLTDPRSWVRLLRGRSDFKVIWRITRDWLTRAGRTASSGCPAARKANIDSTNPRFAEAFLEMLRSDRAILLVFSGADRLHGQFEENFVAHHLDELATLRTKYEMHVVPNANHVLSSPAWVAELLEVACKWLDVRYPAAGTSNS